MDTRIREDHVAPSTNEVAIDTVADPRDQALSHAVLQAVLDGDYERARCLAEKWPRLAANAPVLRTVKYLVVALFFFLWLPRITHPTVLRLDVRSNRKMHLRVPELRGGATRVRPLPSQVFPDGLEDVVGLRSHRSDNFVRT
jgi:hypothetical protein